MKQLDKSTAKINTELKNVNHEFSPTIIAGIIAAAILIFKNCDLSFRRKKRILNNPRRLHKLILRNIIEDHAPRDHDALEAAFLDYAEQVTDQEFRDLLEGK